MDKTFVKNTLNACLPEYGYFHEPLRDKWARYEQTAGVPKFLVAALNNSDSTFVSLKLFEEDFDSFIAGVEAVCSAFGITAVQIYLPEPLKEELRETAEKIKNTLSELDVAILFSKVNVQKLGTGFLMHHLETLENIGRVESHLLPTRFVSVKNGAEEKIIKVAPDATIRVIFAASGMSAGTCRYFLAGGRRGDLLPVTELEKSFVGYGNSELELVADPFCVVDLAAHAEESAYDRSCGKCNLCREGNYQLWKFMRNVSLGHGSAQDMEWVDTIAEAVSDESVCSFGRESVRFLKSTWGPFKSDYESHFKLKRCPVNICLGYVDFAIDKSKCDGCRKCLEVCKADAIHKDGDGYVIDMLECTKCGKCVSVCPQGAIGRVRVGNGNTVPQTKRPGQIPVRPTSRRRYK